MTGSQLVSTSTRCASFSERLKGDRDLRYARRCPNQSTQRRSLPMDLSTFIIGVFDLCEDWLNDQQPIRSRGPAPKLSDSEVITMEIVGEFLERVMNLGENRIEMRIPQSAWLPRDLCFLHS